MAQMDMKPHVEVKEWKIIKWDTTAEGAKYPFEVRIGGDGLRTQIHTINLWQFITDADLDDLRKNEGQDITILK